MVKDCRKQVSLPRSLPDEPSWMAAGDRWLVGLGTQPLRPRLSGASGGTGWGLHRLKGTVAVRSVVVASSVRQDDRIDAWHREAFAAEHVGSASRMAGLNPFYSRGTFPEMEPVSRHIRIVE